MNNRATTTSARKLAWQCLWRWGAKQGVFADSLIHLAEGGLSNSDRAMLQAIVLGTLRHLRLLEEQLATLRGKKPLQGNARWLLLSGLCQLFVLKWPEYAVVNELVELAPQSMRGLINGVLRESLRQREQWEARLPQLSLGVRYSMPDWLVGRWTKRFGAKECRELLEWFAQPASVFLRVNLLNPPPSIPANWAPLPNLPGWFRLTDGHFPHDYVRAGQVYATDPATRHSIELLAPTAGETILDACAAPGGKSIAILSATQGNCSLLSTDSVQSRLPMLRSNLQRAVGHPTRVELYDWTQQPKAKLRRAFDAVLADVPCSNSGVLQRRVDARWRFSPTELNHLTSIQFQIAKHAMQAVKPGGRFVYSTCSIEPEENNEIVQRILAENPGWSLAEERLILPHREHTDGAYCALLRAPLSS